MARRLLVLVMPSLVVAAACPAGGPSSSSPGSSSGGSSGAASSSSGVSPTSAGGVSSSWSAATSQATSSGQPASGREACLPDVLHDAGVGRDAGAAPRDAGQPDAGRCLDDGYEPNDVAGDAKPLAVTGEGATLPDLQSCGEDDWFLVPVPGGSGVRVTMDFLHAEADLDLFLHLAATPPEELDRAEGMLDQEIVQYPFLSVTTDLLLHVRNVSQRPAGYALTVQFPAGGCPQDALEENDTAASPRYVPATYNPGLFVCPGDPDFYSFTVPAPGPDTMVRLVHPAPGGDIVTRVMELGSATVLATGTYAGGASTVGFTSTGGKTYLLSVEYAGTGVATGYALHMARGGFCVRDASEPNNNEATATTLTGTAWDLRACEDDPDYFRFTVPAPGPDTRVRVFHDRSRGDISGQVFLPGGEDDPVALLGEYDPTWGGREALFTSSATSYFLKVTTAAGWGESDYRVVLAGDAFCADDAREPNDTPETATTMPGSMLSGLVLCGTNPDLLRFTVANPGEGTRVVVSHPSAAVQVQLTDGSGAPVPTTTSAEPGRTTLAFTSAAGTPYLLRVQGAPGHARSTYSVSVLGAPPANNTCQAATPVTPPATFHGTTVGATNALAFGHNGCTGFFNDGPDVFYVVEVRPGGTIRATLTSVEDLALYLVDGCDTRCCWGGTDTAMGGRDEVLDYRNVTTSPQVLYLGVDSWGGTVAGDFTLVVEWG